MVWIDFAKACAIFLVVLGHSDLISPSDRNFIYMFHVPAFLFLTGALLPQTLPSIPYRQFVGQQVLPIMRLYLFFSACSVALFAFGLIWQQVPWLAPVGASVRAVLTGVHGPQDAFLHMNAPLWYFPFLVVSLVAVRFAASLPVLAGGGLLIVAAVAGLMTAGTIYPWYANFAGIGGLFIGAGWAVVRYGPGLVARLRYTTLLTLLALVLAVAALWVLPQWTTRPNINNGTFGNSGLLYFAGAFSGIAVICLTGLLVPSFTAVRLLSEHTLVIFCTHIYVLRLAEDLLDIERNALKTAIGVTAMVIALCLGLSILLMPALRRHVIRR
jgi:acyltransferase